MHVQLFVCVLRKILPITAAINRDSGCCVRVVCVEVGILCERFALDLGDAAVELPPHGESKQKCFEDGVTGWFLNKCTLVRVCIPTGTSVPSPS